MTNLTAAANVLAPAYHLLCKQGYHVYYAKDNDWWVAEKGEVRLVAYSTIELCGLAYIHDAKGNNWSVTDEEIDMYLSLEKSL